MIDLDFTETAYRSFMSPATAAGKSCCRSLIHYQEDAVVRRTLVDSPAGQVEMIALDAAQQLPEMVTPGEAALYILEGDVEIYLDRQKQHQTAGKIITLSARTPWTASAIKPSKLLLIQGGPSPAAAQASAIHGGSCHL